MYDSGVYLFSLRSLQTVVYMFPRRAGVQALAVSSNICRGGRVDTRRPGLVGTEVLSVDRVQRSPVYTPSPRSIHTPGPGPVHTSCPRADVELLLGDGLQVVQAPQLLVERVHHHQGADVEDVENHPGEEREEVITEDHVIDDCRVTQLHNLPDDEECHCDEPGHEPRLVLQSDGVEEEAGGEEEREGGEEGDDGGEEEDVPDVVVPDVDKLVGHPVVAGVD